MKKSLHNTFARQCYASFLRVGGAPLTLIPLLLGFAYFGLSGNTSSIQYKFILPVLGVLLILIITLFDLSYRLFAKTVNQLPGVKQASKPPSSHPNATAILLLENSEIYGYETYVSIYYTKNGFEVLVGIGFVYILQDNGYIQILVTSPPEAAHTDIWQQIYNNDINALSNLLVKPSLSKGIHYE